MTTTAQFPTTVRRPHFDGRVLTPGTRGYDSARSVWNGMIDHRPKLIVGCASVDDVITAVRTARERDLEIGVRCGGHNIAGLAVPHGGLMIDLTGLGRVTVDPVRRRARVQGGAMLGALDRATQPFGLATTAGNVSHTGVGGLTLGGGMGWLARQYGLTCDNVVSYPVVTADGRLVRASRTEHPDLYGGLRGGGGNFGVVVEFEFGLHPAGTRALVVELTFGAEHAAAALRGWRDLAERAAAGHIHRVDPRRTGPGRLRVGRRPAARPDAGRAAGRARRADGAARRRDLLHRPAAPRRHAPRPRPAPLLEGPLSASTARRRDRRAAGGRGEQPDRDLQAYGGAIVDVLDDATAFSHRDTALEYVASTSWTDPAEDQARMAAARGGPSPSPRSPAASTSTCSATRARAGVRRGYPEPSCARSPR